MKQPILQSTAFTQTAQTIGRTLLRDAIWHEGRCTWLTSSNEPNDTYLKPYFKTADADMYSGTAGMAFFLAALYRQTGDSLSKETALAAFRQTFSQLEKIPETGRLGFFSGWTGIAWAAFNAAEWLESDYLLAQSKSLLEKIVRLSAEKSGIDVIDGAAGAIPALRQMLGLNSSLKKYIIYLADYLVSQAQLSPIGASWQTIVQENRPNLTGFAHGVAGIVNAFFDAFALSQDPKYLRMADLGLQYENYYFDTHQQNWPDFRSFAEQNGKPSFSCAWCHGAAGIVLSRLQGYTFTQQEALLTDAKAGISTTLANLQPEEMANFSLCHGYAGNAEILLEAAHYLHDGSLRKKVEEVGNFGIERFTQTGVWLNGLMNSYQLPDFMLGLSGIGYFYLRLADSRTYPSVLFLGNQAQRHFSDLVSQKQESA